MKGDIEIYYEIDNITASQFVKVYELINLMQHQIEVLNHKIKLLEKHTRNIDGLRHHVNE